MRQRGEFEEMGVVGLSGTESGLNLYPDLSS